MQNKTEILIPDVIYHIYNRANGSEKLFRSAENYRYFLQKYQEYISPIADTFCYCLMPNHFHFLIRIKSEHDLIDRFNARAGQSATLQGFKTLEGLSARQAALSKLLNQQFSHFFNGYTQAFNKQHLRKGSLFMHPFKRKQVTQEIYFRKLIHYIHHNPGEAGLCDQPGKWPYSSYSEFFRSEPGFLEKAEVIGWFGDIANFTHVHSELPELSGIDQIQD